MNKGNKDFSKIVDEWAPSIEELRASLRVDPLPVRSIFPSIMLIIFGGIAMVPSAIIATYVFSYISKIPYVVKNGNTEELGAFLVLSVVASIFGGCKWYYRHFCSNKCVVRINFIGATFIGVMLALFSTYVVTLTEIYIFTSSVFTVGNAILLSISRHPFLMLTVLSSCIISLWSTMPNSIKNILAIGGLLGIIED